MARTAAAIGIPLRIDEANNVSCGGLPHVSDTFAASLWAVDFLTRAMSAGLAGINFHDVLAAPQGYSPVVAGSPEALAAGQFEVRPEYYALLLARALVGTFPHPVSVRPAIPGVSVTAFSSPTAERVVVVDNHPAGSRTLYVRLALPAGHYSSTVMRLTAPSRAATADVTLGGRSVTAAGTWTPAPSLPAATVKGGFAQAAIAPGSAALITFRRRA